MNDHLSQKSISISVFFSFLFILTLLVPSPTKAQVDLSWTPSDTTTVAPGGTARLSIHLDDSINFRTIEVTATYDTNIILSLGGGPGALYAESGFYIFDGFEETPGTWHGYAIVMGAEDFLTGPGEVLFWDIEGLAEGTAPVIVVEARLYDELSPPNPIPDVALSTATVIVDGPLSAVQNIPNALPQLVVTPNPFNPQTRISFDLSAEAQVRLSVFDARGRLIAVLHDGPASVGTLTKDWNGTDSQGRAQPGGVYLFQLETPDRAALAKGILVK